jgi:hypothetical protein
MGSLLQLADGDYALLNAGRLSSRKRGAKPKGAEPWH